MAKKFKLTKQKIWTAIGVVVLLLGMVAAGMFLWWLQNKDRITSDLDPISAAPKLPAAVEESQKLAANGQTEEANKKLQEAIDQTNEPELKQQFTVQQGVNYDNSGDYQKALEVYLEAEKIKSNFTTSHLIGEIYERLGNKEKAIEYFKKTVSQLDTSLPDYNDELNLWQNRIRALGGQP